MEIRKTLRGNVKRISLVESPANGESICGVVFCSIDSNYVTTVVLNSEQLIYREPKNGNDEYFFYIEEPVVNDMAHQFLENNLNTNLSTDHSPYLDSGIKLAESWVYEGVWRVKLRIDDPEIMARIHNGELTGASIEADQEMLTVLEVTDDLEKFQADARALDYNTKRIIFGGMIE